MNQHKFYPVQEPQPEELDESVLDQATNLVNRFSMVMQPGIVPASEIHAVTGDDRFNTLGDFAATYNTGATAGTDAAFMLYIGSGMAFGRNPINDPDEQPYLFNNPVDIKLERIFISPTEILPYNAANPAATDVLGNPQPKSTGSNGILLAPADIHGDRGITGAGAYFNVYIRHLQVVDTLTNDPSNPGNKYTINPFSGQINYTHFVDGYQITFVKNGVSLETSDVFLCKVTCTMFGIVSIDKTACRYAYINSAMVQTKLDPALYPPSRGRGYTYGNYVSFSDHVNSVYDQAQVSAANPHGIPIGGGPGGTGAGIYANNPGDFHANGIVDSAAGAGGFQATASTAEGIPATVVISPSTARLYIKDQRFDSASYFWSEGFTGGVLLPQHIVVSGNPILCAEFPPATPLIRPSGLYLVYGENYPDPTNPGLIVRAKQVVGATLGQIVANPTNYLTVPAVQYPFGVCNWNGNSFDIMVDPQTGFSTNYRMIDVRQVGTITADQLSTNYRYYPGATGPTLHTVALNKDIAVTGTVSATKFVGDGSGLFNVVKAAAQKVTQAYFVVNGSSTWTDLTYFTVTVTTKGGPLFLQFDGDFMTNVGGNTVGVDFVVDGAQLYPASFGYGLKRLSTVNAWQYYHGSMSYMAFVAAGSHTIGVRWRQAAASGQMYLNDINGSITGASCLTVHEV